MIIEEPLYCVQCGLSIKADVGCPSCDLGPEESIEDQDYYPCPEDIDDSLEKFYHGDSHD